MSVGDQGDDERRLVGRYEILREIGRGGMAIVYAARQPDLDRQVALKELSRFHAGSAEFAHRFLRESRLAGSLNHPNIVTVHEYFEHARTPYIAMELIPRGSLRPYMKRLSLAQIGGVLEGVLAGFAHAEANGIVHRDLKPENIMVTADGRVKIADFGIARATQRAGTKFMTATGMTVGTPSYMAPEQAMAGEIGSWTDLYSVGVLTFELLVGHVPFHDTDAPMVILMRQVNEPIPSPMEVRPDVDPGLSKWVDSLLIKDPKERVRHALTAWDSLEEIIVGLLGPLWRRSARLLEDQADVLEADPLTPAPFESQGSIRTPTPRPTSVPEAFVTFDPGGAPLSEAPPAHKAPPAEEAPPGDKAPTGEEAPPAKEPAAEIPPTEAVPPVEPPAARTPPPQPAVEPVAPPVPPAPAPTPDPGADEFVTFGKPQLSAPAKAAAAAAAVAAAATAAVDKVAEPPTAKPPAEEQPAAPPEEQPATPPEGQPATPSEEQRAAPVEEHPAAPSAPAPGAESEFVTYGQPSPTPSASPDPAAAVEATPEPETEPISEPTLEPLETAGEPAQAEPSPVLTPDPQEAVAEPAESVAEPREGVAAPQEAVAEPTEAVAEPEQAVAGPAAEAGEREEGVAPPEEEPAGPEEPARPRHARSGSRGPILVLAGVVAVVAAAGGFIIAHGSGGKKATPEALSQTAAAGPVSVSYPAGWRKTSTSDPATAALRLTNPVALAPTQAGGGSLVVGTAKTTNPTLLPDSFRAKLPSPPQGASVKLGSQTYRRYLDLLPTGASTPENVYALPTTAGTVIASCVAASGDEAEFASTCERTISSLKLASGTTTLPLTANGKYAAALGAIIARLSSTRAAGSRKLATAKRPSDQATAARQLAVAHKQAADAAAKLDPGPIGADGNQQIVLGLRELGAAYTALANAAQHNDKGAYGAARTAVDHAGSILSGGFAKLRQEGYTIS